MRKNEDRNPNTELINQKANIIRICLEQIVDMRNMRDRDYDLFCKASKEYEKKPSEYAYEERRNTYNSYAESRAIMDGVLLLATKITGQSAEELCEKERQWHNV